MQITGYPSKGKNPKEGAAAAGHRGVEGAVGVDAGLEVSECGVKGDDAGFEGVRDGLGPTLDRTSQALGQGGVRNGRGDTGIGLGCADRDAFGNIDADAVAVEEIPHREVFQNFAPAAAQHRTGAAWHGKTGGSRRTGY